MVWHIQRWISDNYTNLTWEKEIFFTGLSATHSSSHFTVRSTEFLFLFFDTHAGTSSAKVAQRFGLKEEIIPMYSAGLICQQIISLEIFKK